MRAATQRAVRAASFARSQGLARLVEEKALDPRPRARAALVRRRWRRANQVAPGTAVPVWVVGVQRSGTNMIVRSLGTAPEVDVCSENDRRAFRDFRVRSDAHLASVLERSRHRFVVFKPVSDSHLVAAWLDRLPAPPGRAIWAVRSVEGRTRSAVARFGDAGREALRDIAAGRGEGRWQAQGLSAESHRLLQTLDVGAMSPASGAALLWYVRNALFFDLGLDDRDDVLLVHYEDLVGDPVPTMTRVCAFLQLPFRLSMVAGIELRPPATPQPLSIDPAVKALCDSLTCRLRRAHESRMD